MWLLLALACSTPPCDVDCQAARLWSGDHATLPAAVKAIEDPMERTAVVLALAEAHPGQQSTLCHSLSAEPDRRRCEQIHQRPHLRATPADPPRHLLAFDSISPFAEVPPNAGDCEDDRACLSRQAKAAASVGRADIAATRCQAIEAGTWRDECYFLAAESTQLHAAARLCRASGAFVGDCMAHMAFDLALRGPTWPSPDPSDWQGVADGAAAASKEVPELGERLSQTIWATATLRAYYGVSEVVGTDAAPATHVTAAAAWRYVGLHKGDSHSLSEWQAGLETALQASGGGPVAGAALVNAAQPALSWSPRGPERELALVPYLGSTTLRASSERDDTLICLLEALAWWKLTAPLSEALTHGDEVVRWTAVRLAGALGEPLPASDDSPLVAARLR